MNMSNIESFIKLLNTYWHNVIGLIITNIFFLSISISFVSQLKLSTAPTTTILFTIFVIITVCWFKSNSIQKTKKGKVGFVLSLYCEDEDSLKKIRSDFVLTLRRLIKNGQAGTKFQFIEIQNHFAKNISDIDDAQKLRIKVKAHFLLYGRVRLRKINGQEQYYIELDGIVSHKPIAENIRQNLAHEFGELLNRKVIISKENDIFAFEFFSEWIDIVSKYIIGIASALSGDIDYAETLYKDVSIKISSINQDIPMIHKLKERIPIRLFELYNARAQYYYERWVSTHDVLYLQQMSPLLKLIDTKVFKDAGNLHINSIYCFLVEKDINKSFSLLNDCPAQWRDGIWHLNIAFLYAYIGDLKTAIKHYRNSLTIPIPADVITKVEDFLNFIVDNENDKYQLYYLLGFFNWKIKGDISLTIEYFQLFLNNSQEGKFLKEIELTNKWLDELTKQ